MKSSNEEEESGGSNDDQFSSPISPVSPIQPMSTDWSNAIDAQEMGAGGVGGGISSGSLHESLHELSRWKIFEKKKLRLACWLEGGKVGNSSLSACLSTRGSGGWEGQTEDRRVRLCSNSLLDACVCVGEGGSGKRERVLGQCKHPFHMHCIVKWTNTQSGQKPACPLCRQQEWKFATS
ncbi:hypothetical protein niasHT_003234 [Heterodera trifolii]|uniref:RING-type domain-containing protein n=1 Tax=Heterodera trifolii TaxID=157864 RepID=A0ABD2MAC3_9BILA